jgi:hypothetical protein
MNPSPKWWLKREHRVITLATAAFAIACVSACLGIAGVVPLPELGDASVETRDGEPVADGGPPNAVVNADVAAVSDAAVDAVADSGDAALDATAIRDAAVESGPPPVYSALNDSSKWTVFDVTTVGAPAAFLGAVFDGRYIELVPAGSNVVVRYDTHSSFTASPSWLTFDAGSPVDGGAGFAGAAFDGHYVYLAPSASDNGNVLRYDTTGSFASSTAWTSFNVATVNQDAQGFAGGAVFDGRYVYFVPYLNANLFDGLVTRYDTQAAFTAVGSWATFDVNTVTEGARGFRGSAFDGRYLYLAPFANAPFVFDGIVPRFDTQALFTEVPSWKTFDLSTDFDGGARGFEGAVFDGTYVYFAPNDNAAASDGVVVRYNVGSSLTSDSSWQSFDVSSVSADAVGFLGAAFDGRYVYLIPSTATVLARYDTQGGFASAASWSVFDLSTVSGKVTEYQTAAFDGRYLYLMPASNGLVLRFDARTPAGLPPAFAGSFF